MESIEEITESILQFQQQLRQIETAIEHADEISRDTLIKIRDDLLELIHCSRDKLNCLQSSNDNATADSSVNSEPKLELDDEFARFQAEISAMDQSAANDVADEANTSALSANREELEDSIKSNADSLNGMKCQAPFEHEWGRKGFYNSIIMSVEDVTEEDNETDLFVRVLFLNPLSEAMKTCDYFMQGSCKFDEENCKFSHGVITKLSDLKEFKPPDFSKLGSETNCLAKYADGLWYKATVVLLMDDKCTVKYESYDETVDLDFCDILPIGNSNADDLSSDSGSDSSDLSELDTSASYENESISNVQHSSGPLGDWEKYTKGIGSKIMLKMGYKFGSGLGRNGEGRIDPIEAVILPPGKSLDKCMQLREMAAGRDLRTVERKLRRQQMKQVAKIKRGYHSEERGTLFDFINKNLCSDSNNTKNSKQSNDIKKETNKDLNVQMLQIGETISKKQQEIERVKFAIERNMAKRDLITVNRLKQELEKRGGELERLQRREGSIQREQKIRFDTKKLNIF